MTIAERLETVFRDLFNDEGIVLTDDTTSADITGWDSLAHVNLMFSIEQEFGVQFDDDQFTEFTDVGELRRMLERDLGESSP